MIGQYDDNLPPQLSTDSSFNNEELMCPHCGCMDKKLVTTNSSDELQCENCGFSETKEDE